MRTEQSPDTSIQKGTGLEHNHKPCQRTGSMNGHTKREIIPLERKEINLEKPKIKSIGPTYVIYYYLCEKYIYTRAHLILEPNQSGPARFWALTETNTMICGSVKNEMGHPLKFHDLSIIIQYLCFLWDFLFRI